MSDMAAWSYTSTLTVWQITGVDKYSQPSFAAPVTLMGTWKQGGDVQTDADGRQFVPTSSYYFEAAEGSSTIPKRGSYIKVGNHTAVANPLTANAELVKKVEGYDTSMFNAGLPDWVVYT